MQPVQKMTTFHLGSWEEEIGYSQSVRVGNRIIVSGAVGDDTVSKDTESQLKDAYQTIIATLSHDGANLQNVIKETIYCRDMDALIKCQDIRKKIYEGHMPATTWIQVERLYSPGHLIEIEVEAILF